MVTEDRIELEKNAPFEEIGKDWYVHLLECVPPERWCNPYREGGWFSRANPTATTGTPGKHITTSASSMQVSIMQGAGAPE